ncbi:MAG: hypothetical protein JO006_15230 [Paucibacter sp.]|nr:hypothetical protein [Roseateles sp.]
MGQIVRTSQRRSQRGQRGQTLILTISILLVLFLGFLYLMRRVMIDTSVAGNTVARQRDVQVADIALRNLEQTIFNAYGDQPLERSAIGQAWWRAVAPGTALPATFWSTCQAANTCAVIPVTVNGQAMPYTALASVQATGRQPDPYTCQMQNFAAYYYDVNIHISEASGATAANTETVYKLCVFDPNLNH